MMRKDTIAPTLDVDLDNLHKLPTVGDRLRTWRRSLGLTQEDLGKKLGIDKTTLRKYELGINPPGAHALDAACKLGLNINWVLTGEASMAKPMADHACASPLVHAIADAMARLEIVDPEKFQILARGFVSRVHEALRLSELEKMNSAFGEETQFGNSKSH